jgi:hypothetical protein
MRTKIGVALTTINVPKNLETFQSYLNDLPSNVDFEFYVVLDENTNVNALDYCKRLNKKYKANIFVLTPEEQIEIFKSSMKLIVTSIPFSSIQRRNFGIIYSLMRGCQVVYLLDDDNFPISDTFIYSAQIIGQLNSFSTVSHPSGWVNTCDFLECDNGDRIFHRGFPPELRSNYDKKAYRISTTNEDKKISVVAGLWLGDPDIDSVSRLASEPAAKNSTFNGYKVIKSDNYTVFNSQNTFISRDIALAYFLSPSLPRYDDIWISLVISKMMTIKGELIAFGEPVVNQIRNPHNYWKDVDLEKEAWNATNELVNLLNLMPNEPTLEYIELAEAWVSRLLLSNKLVKMSRLVHSFVSEYAIWIHVISRNFHTRKLL